MTEETQEPEQTTSNKDFNLLRVFTNAGQGIRGLANKYSRLAINYGMTSTAGSFLTDALFGYIEVYIDGATCPNCYCRMGHASEVPNFTICGNCEEQVNAIKVTPIRMYLTIANNADLFELFPNKIKADPKQLNIIKRFGPQILTIYDQITLEMMMEPLLAWLKDHRPDLYYTIAFYPTAPDHIQMLYDLKMGDMPVEEQKKVAKSLGLYDYTKLYDVMLQGLEEVIERRSEYYVMEGKQYITKFDERSAAEEYIESHRDRYPKAEVVRMLGVSTYALKTFNRQVESLKNNMRSILEEWLV